MLSVPLSLFESFATKSSNSYYSTLPNLFSSFNFLLIHSTICCDDLLYQIPSHPIIMKCNPLRGNFVIYGFDVIICSSKPKFLFSLNSRSPKALVKFKQPFTLPYSRCPPAFKIRLYYYGS